MSNRPFDLEKLDFDTRRKEQRRRLLLRSLPVIVLVFVAGVALVLPTLLTQKATVEFSNEDYSQAADSVAPLQFLNVIEPYKVHYNYGTALSAKGEFESALQKLETALAYTNDPEVVCVITYNLVLTMEGAGDDKLKQANLSGAITFYTRALNRIKDNATCFKDSPLQKRIEDKLKATEEARAKQGSNGESEESPDGTPASAKQEKLKDIEAEASRDRSEAENRNQEYVTPDPKVKPW